MISLFFSEPLRRVRSKRLWAKLWVGIEKAAAGEERDKNGKKRVERELRAFGGTRRPEVKSEVLRTGKY
jgi:hypothetical protein